MHIFLTWGASANFAESYPMITKDFSLSKVGLYLDLNGHNFPHINPFFFKEKSTQNL